MKGTAYTLKIGGRDFLRIGEFVIPVYDIDDITLATPDRPKASITVASAQTRATYSLSPETSEALSQFICRGGKL